MRRGKESGEGPRSGDVSRDVRRCIEEGLATESLRELEGCVESSLPTHSSADAEKKGTPATRRSDSTHTDLMLRSGSSRFKAVIHASKR